MQRKFMIHKHAFFMTMAFAAYAYPVGLLYLFHMATIYKYIQYIFLGCMLLIAINGKKVRNIYCLGGCAFVLYLLLVTCANHGSILSWWEFAYPLIMAILWISIAIRKQLEYILHYIAVYLCGVTIINVIGILLGISFHTSTQTNGFGIVRYSQTVNFISNDNSLLPYLLPACAIVLCYLILKKKSMFHCILVTVLFFSAPVLVWSGTAVGIELLLIIIYITPLREKITNTISIIFTVILNSILIAGSVALPVAVSWFITVVLKKQLNFSGRTDLWMKAILKILEKPIWGHGMLDSELLFSTSKYAASFTSHNMYLQIGIWGGILGIILLVSWLYFSGRKRRKNSINSILICAVLGVLIYFSFEVHKTIFMWYVCIGMMYYFSGENWIEKIGGNKGE